MNLIRKKAYYALFLLITIFTAAFFIFYPKNASAAVPISSSINNVGPTSGSGILNPGKTITPYYTVGQGGYNYASSYISIAVPINVSSFNIYIKNSGFDCTSVTSGSLTGPDFGGAATTYHLYSMSSKSYNEIRNPGSGCGQINFNSIRNSDYCKNSDEIINGSSAYCVYYLDTSISIGGDDRENAFRVEASDPSISVGVNGDFGDAIGYGYRDENINLGATWGFNIQFTVADSTCVNSQPRTSSGPVKWFDSDPDRTDWNDNMVFRIWQQSITSSPSNPNAWNNFGTFSQKGWAIPNIGGFGDMTYSANTRYMVTFENLGTRNTLKVKLPNGLSQFAAKRNQAINCGGVTDVCPYIDGVPDSKPQNSVPPGYTRKANGDCVKTVTSGGTSTCVLKPTNPSIGTRIPYGSQASFTVQVTNGSNTIWAGTTNKSVSPWRITAFLTMNNPSPYAGYIQKYGNGGNQPTLNPNQTGGETTINVDTSSLGLKTYNFYLVWLDKLDGSFVNIEGGVVCGIEYTVFDNPVGNVTVSCNGVFANVGWQYSGGSAPYTVNASGATKDVAAGVNQTSAFNGYSQPIMPYEQRTYEIWAKSSDGVDNIWIGSAYMNEKCLNVVCSVTQTSYRAGQPTPTTVRAEFTNSTDTTYGSRMIVNTKPGLRPATLDKSGTLSPGNSVLDGIMNVIADAKGSFLFMIYVDGNQVPYGYGCDTAYNVDDVFRDPFIKTFSGDTVAGLGFAKANGTCGVSAGANVKAYISSANAGSGSQLATFAPGGIFGFLSSVKNTNPAPKPNGLSFGGVPLTGPLAADQKIGGGYSINGCQEDYFTTKQRTSPQPTPVTNTLNIANLEDAKQYKSFGDLTINGGDLGSKSVSVFVEGNVTLSSNITSNSFDSNKPPAFRLYVKGNIYVDAGITELNGVFVAQPNDDGTRGEIYTCALGNNKVSFGTNGPSILSYANTCKNQLKVYGNFTAKRVFLDRIKNTGTISSINTANDGSIDEYYNSTNASEVFIWPPYLYLPEANRSDAETTGPSSDDYKFIGTLPPVL